MAPATAQGIGDLLREWRNRRHLSQLEVALDSAVSARHLSFVETGRSQPSRELVLHLCEQLEVPLRERNTLLLAAGYAPAYEETALDDESMTPVRSALERLLASHEPFPAAVVNRRWEVLLANGPGLAVMSDGVAPELLAPPVNALRVTLHPDGLAPRIENLAEYSAHLMMRLRREEILSQEPALAELRAEMLSYPGVEDPASAAVEPAELLFVPLRIRRASDGVPLSFFNTISTLGTALDITLSELAVESLFPADESTAAALRDDA